jgi:Big-like domain-containing protein
MPQRAVLLALVLALLGALVPAAAQAATERVRITWNTQTDIDLHVYDDAGNHAYYGEPGAIPNATLSSDNTVGLGPEFFTDDEDPGTARTFRLQVCYFSGEEGATTVAGTVTNGDGSSRPVSVVLNDVGDCAELGVSQGHGSDRDGDGILDGADRCPDQPAPGTADGCPPPENQPPIAVSDHWDVRAGHYVYDNALKNDRDPDGDRFTPRVTSISFRATEWSGMEQDGTFNYMAGPGTRVKQRKVITYHLVDARGARSAPATITIDVIPPGKQRSASPVQTRRGGARASATPRWYSNSTFLYSCFGTGFDRTCYGVLSPGQVQALNATTPWLSLPSPTQAARACALSFRGGGVARCAANLVGGALIRSGDKQIIRVAAQDGDCLLFKQDLNRTPLHPLAGSWTKPHYHSIHSYLRKGTWGTWGKWQVPVSCTSNAAWMYYPKDLVRR